MKTKNIIIGLLAILSLVSWTYTYYWKSVADKQTELAIEFQKVAERSREEAMKQRLFAEEATKQSAGAIELANRTEK